MCKIPTPEIEGNEGFILIDVIENLVHALARYEASKLIPGPRLFSMDKVEGNHTLFWAMSPKKNHLWLPTLDFEN